MDVGDKVLECSSGEIGRIVDYHVVYTVEMYDGEIIDNLSGYDLEWLGY